MSCKIFRSIQVVIIFCFWSSVNSFCNEPLLGNGGILIIADHKNSSVCGFADYADTPVFRVNSHYDDSKASLAVNGSFEVYGTVDVDDSIVVLDGHTYVGCGSQVQLSRNALISAEGLLQVKDNSSVRFGVIDMSETSSSIVVDDNVASNLWFSSLKLHNSRFQLLKGNSPFAVAQMIYGRFKPNSSNLTFAGDINSFQADNRVTFNAIRSEFYLSTQLLSWTFCQVDLADSILWLQDAFQVSHTGQDAVELIRSKVYVKYNSQWNLHNFDLRLTDSTVSVEGGQVFLSDSNIESVSSLQGSNLHVVMKTGATLQMDSHSNVWDLRGVYVVLAEGSLLAAHNCDLYNVAGGVLIVLSKHASLKLNVVNPQQHMVCELLGDIHVPENLSYTQLDVGEALNCTVISAPTSSSIQSKVYNENAATLSHDQSHEVQTEVVSCPLMYHNKTTQTSVVTTVTSDTTSNSTVKSTSAITEAVATPSTAVTSLSSSEANPDTSSVTTSPAEATTTSSEAAWLLPSHILLTACFIMFVHTGY